MSPPPVGVVFCGGGSRRMGRDKALIEVEGRALAARVADALCAAGCERVLAVGGDAPALAALGLEPVGDRWPGEGPLGGLASALAAVLAGSRPAPEGDPRVRTVVAPCDLVAPDPAAFTALLAALDDGDATVATVGGRPQWVVSAWAVTPTLAEAVAGRFGAGERRLDAAAAVARWRAVAVDATAVADADRPDELP